jgi:hypothetical protein
MTAVRISAPANAALPMLTTVLRMQVARIYVIKVQASSSKYRIHTVICSYVDIEMAVRLDDAKALSPIRVTVDVRHTFTMVLSSIIDLNN